MDTKDGKYTTEFYMAAISKIVAVLLPLLIAYGVLDVEKGALWATAILALASIVVPIVNGMVDRKYIEARTSVKLEAMNLERTAAELETVRTEARMEQRRLEALRTNE